MRKDMSNEVLYTLQSYLEHVKIGPPIGTLFTPELSVEEYSHAFFEIALRVTFRSPDAEGRLDKVTINSIDVIGKDHAEFYAVHKEVFINIVYERVEIVLRHELQESFKVNGKHLHDPHPAQVMEKGL